ALALRGALGAGIEQVVTWSLGHYRTRGGINDVPYGSDLGGFAPVLRAIWGTPYWPARVYHLAWTYAYWPLLGLLAAWLAARKAETTPVERLVALVAGAEIVACLVGRADFAHIAMYGSLPLLLGVCWAERLAPRAGLAFAAFGLAGLVLTAQRALFLPTVFMPAQSPDVVLAAFPENQYVRRICSKPEDRVVAIPSGGLTYLYGALPGTRYSLVLPPAMGYMTMAEYVNFWREVMRTRPKLVLIMSTLGRDETMAAYQPPNLRGYRAGPEFVTPLNDQPYHTYTIERVD
ncbi:MAG: hypothetical protein JWM80_3278, partial [Cyanobacteria bacterium RYN_339]|nr:hypothetical protein [Cyanobacteria bacterium RYN_339]